MEKLKKTAEDILLEAGICLAGYITLFLGCYLLGCVLAGSIPDWQELSVQAGMSVADWLMGPDIRIPLFNTAVMLLICLILVLPFGIGTAIFLTEYQGSGDWLTGAIRHSMEVLAGIPSVLYGLFGMLFFVTTLQMGYSILAGSLTMTLVILPLIVQTAEQALEQVPQDLREGGRGLGAGKLRTLFRLVLPEAASGILSGVLLAVGKVAGESAALLYTAGTAEKMPESLLDSGRTLSVQLYLYSSEQGSQGTTDFRTAGWRLALLILLFVFLLQWGAHRLSGRRSLRDHR